MHFTIHSYQGGKRDMTFQDWQPSAQPNLQGLSHVEVARGTPARSAAWLRTIKRKRRMAGPGFALGANLARAAKLNKTLYSDA